MVQAWKNCFTEGAFSGIKFFFKDTDQHRDRLTESLDLVLTKEQAELRPALEKLLRINIDMDRVFKDHMIQWIHALKLAGITPYTACKMYLGGQGRKLLH